jgi:predicted dehydrogenase
MANRMTHRIGVIGLGMGSGPHLQSLKDLGHRAVIAAAFSRSAARRQAQSGLPVTGDLDAVFADPDIDVVAILTPPSSHLELVERAAASGKHILLEKPLDITTARAEALVERIERAGVNAAVMLQHRFKPSAARLRQVLAESSLGAIVGVSLRAPLWRPKAIMMSRAAAPAPATAAAC